MAVDSLVGATRVTKREGYTIEGIRYLRKVWDNGFVDFYKRWDAEGGSKRAPITEADWNNHRADGHDYKVSYGSAPTR